MISNNARNQGTISYSLFYIFHIFTILYLEMLIKINFETNS